MHIEFSLRESDLHALAQHQVRRSPLVPQRIRQQRIAYAFGLGLVALATSFALPESLFPLAFATLSVLCLVLYEPLARRRLRARMARLVRARMSPSSVGLRHLRALPDGLEEETAKTRIRVKWSTVGPVEETPTHAFMAVNGVYSLVIPTDRVAAADLATFRAAVASYRGAAA